MKRGNAMFLRGTIIPVICCLFDENYFAALRASSRARTSCIRFSETGMLSRTKKAMTAVTPP